jgi:hypothetical protein
VGERNLLNFKGRLEVYQLKKNNMRRGLLYKKVFKKTNLCKFRKFDYKKMFYYSKFNKIPYKDKFFYSKGSRLIKVTTGNDFFAHNGRY